MARSKRKRLNKLIFIVPLAFCIAYVLCVYAIYRSHLRHLKKPRLGANDRHRFTSSMSFRKSSANESAEYSFVIPDSQFIVDEMMGLTRRHIQTDIDRMEEKKRKKKREKFKQELTKKCLVKKSACDELKMLDAEDNGARGVAVRTLRPNRGVTSPVLSSEPGWSSYADKGFAIVGETGDLRRRLPQVVIIGAKKCGTRALLEFLRIHPSIAAAGIELHFFNKYYYKGLSWYRSKLPLSLEGQLTVEKTPAYFVDKDAPSRMKNLLPSARLLLVVRDPVVRAISDYAQSLSKHNHDMTFSSRALINASSGLVNVAWGPVRGGLYARHYQRWREAFPRSSIHVVSGENLVRDPAQEMQAVQDFLNLERVINDRHFYFNASKGFPCLVKRERNGKPHCLGNSKGRTHPKVDQSTIDTLRNFYRPFNLKFYKMIGRNFNWP